MSSRSPGGSPASDPEAFAAIAADLDYPMILVTADDGRSREGCLVGFWTQCSIEPARLLVCLSKLNRTHDVAMRASHLGVHFLSADEGRLAELFGGTTGDHLDKFALWPWHAGPDGVPVVEGCRRWVAARVLGRFDAGDHTALLVEPGAGRCPPWPGQLGFSRARRVDPGHPADEMAAGTQGPG